MNDIIINNSKVVINTPPKKAHHFKRMLKIGKLRFYVTWNYRLKNSQSRDNQRGLFSIVPLKEKKWSKTEHRCEMCGKEIGKFGQSQLHHILPYSKFPNLSQTESNLMLLCAGCHKKIHTNPFLDCKLQTEKAKEFNIDLKDYYENEREKI